MVLPFFVENFITVTYNSHWHINLGQIIRMNKSISEQERLNVFRHHNLILYLNFV